MTFVELIKTPKNIPFTLGLPIMIFLIVGVVHIISIDNDIHDNYNDIIVLQDKLLTKQRMLIDVLNDTVKTKQEIIDILEEEVSVLKGTNQEYVERNLLDDTKWGNWIYVDVLQYGVTKTPETFCSQWIGIYELKVSEQSGKEMIRCVVPTSYSNTEVMQK